MMRQFELVELVKSYDPNADEDALNRAYVYSMKAHGAQLRASGDPYFSHPVEVAGILAQMKLDSASIVTGLLHDTVEDTVATLDDIERVFGPEIARLVDGVTKLSRIELQSDQTKQAENFRKLVLAMSEDIRVLLVKLADRLHNMQTLHFIQERRKAPADRARDDGHLRAARRAHRHAPDEGRARGSGLCRALSRCAREHHRAARFSARQGRDVVPRIEAELQRKLAEGGLAGTVISGREKSPYSIWRKMQRKNVALRAALRRHGVPRCWSTVSASATTRWASSTRAYHVVPGRFKDYISTPKPNNYRSLHTGVIGPERQRIECRSAPARCTRWPSSASPRTGSTSRARGTTDGPQYRWLRELLDILEHASGPEEFLEHTKLEMFQDQVFCLHPEGRPDRAAARRHAGRFRLCRPFARSATPASAPRSTAG